MNNVYDNGYRVLGKVKDIKKYFKENIKTSDLEEEIYDLLKELNEYNEEDIIIVDYDNGMGIYINELFSKNDIVKVGD